MKVLVTGATGFIGSRICQHLALKGMDIFSTGRSKKTTFTSIQNIKHIPGDLQDRDFCDEITKEVNFVIHCAGKAGPWGAFNSFYDANVKTTKNLLINSKKNGASKFINLSTPSIYFNYQNLFDVKETFKPKKFSNAYAETKYLAEKEVQNAHSLEFQTLSLRPRFVIGAGDTNVLPRLIRIYRQGKLKKVGDGRNIVSVTSIGNLLHAIDLSLEAPSDAMGKVYNIANEKPVVFWEFVDEVLTSVGTLNKYQKLPYSLVSLLAKMNYYFATITRQEREPSLLPISVAVLAKSMTLNIDLAKRELGYNPIVTTKEGISEFIEDWKKN